MGNVFQHYYYFIRKNDGLCVQLNKCNVADYSLDTNELFSVHADGIYNIGGAYLLRPDMTPAQSANDKANWFRKIYADVDETGEPLEGATFEWVSFVPELVKE